MNISLSKAKSKTKKKFGLVKKSSAPAGFGDSSSDEDEREAGGKGNARSEVNRDLAAEQAALRKRAQATLQANTADSSIYDYDGAYDSFAPNKDDPSKKQSSDPKKSRYICDLLKAAKRREKERDIIHERKIAKEQQAEDEEFGDKDKFVTKAYKRKLAERELWAQEEAARQEKEEAEDVTKKNSTGAFASFYGNLTKNVAMGGEAPKDREVKRNAANERKDEIDSSGQRSANKPAALGFMDGFEAASSSEPKLEVPTTDSNPVQSESAEDSELVMRRKRADKVARARIRYFQRQGISEEDAVPKQ